MQRHDEERGLRSWSRRTARHEKLREKARGAMDEFIPGAMDARRLRVSFWRIGYAGGNGVVPTGNLQSRPAACCYVAVSVCCLACVVRCLRDWSSTYGEPPVPACSMCSSVRFLVYLPAEGNGCSQPKLRVCSLSRIFSCVRVSLPAAAELIFL